MGEKPSEQLIELLAVMGMIILVLLPAFFYEELPESIPTHFGGSGKADAWGAKSSIWLLPVIGAVIYFTLTGLNYFIKNTNPKPKHGQSQAMANAHKDISIEMLRALKAAILICFAYIVWATIQTALGNYDGLGSFFIFVFLALVLGTTGYYIYRMLKLKEEEL